MFLAAPIPRKRLFSTIVLIITVIDTLMLTHCVPAADPLSPDATAGVLTAGSTDLPAEAAHLSPEALWAINLALESEAGLDRVLDEDGSTEPVIITRVQLMMASDYFDRSMVADLPRLTRIWVITLQGRWRQLDFGEMSGVEGPLREAIYNLQVLVNADTAEKLGTVYGLLSPGGEFLSSGQEMSIETHIVTDGQTLGDIAALHQISTESILMSNWALLEGDFYNLTSGMELLLPPAEGALYRWTGSGGELWMVAEMFNIYTEHIWLWTGEELGFRAFPAAAAESMELAPGSLLFLQGVDLEIFVQ